MIQIIRPNSSLAGSRISLRFLLLLLILGLFLFDSQAKRPALFPNTSGLATVLAKPEVTAWRTENSRHYDLGNGRYAAIIQPLTPVNDLAATLGVVQEVVQGSVALVEGQPETSKPAFRQSCVGNFVAADGVRSLRRAYVRFSLANLPANVGSNEIIGASFYAAPDGALAPASNVPEPFYEEFGFTTMPVTVHPVTDDSWIEAVQDEDTLVFWPAMGAAVPPLAGEDGYLWKDDNQNAWLSEGWDVTGVVRDWYNAPGANYGLALRMAGAETFANYDVPGSGLPASFMCFPTPSAYAYSTFNDGRPLAPGTTMGPGMALLVEYTIPTLATNAIFQTAVPSTAPVDAYVNQTHHYALQASSSQWQMLAARGNPQTGFPLPNVPVKLWEYNIGGGLPRVYADEGRDTPNYIAINPNAVALGETVVAQILPEKSPAGANHDAKQYQLQFLAALPTPVTMPIPPNTYINIPLSYPVGNLVLGQQLAFAADTTVEVRVEGLFAYNDVRIFAPINDYESRDGAGALPLIFDGQAHEIEFSVNAATAGTWLLAFTHTLTDPVWPNVEVTVCANSDNVVRYPLEGECLELRRPDPGDFNDQTLKTVGNVRVYSPGGFSGNCSTGCTTINTAPSGEPVMPLVGHTNNPTEWVALKGGTATVFSGLNQRVEITNGTRLVLANFANPAEIISLPVLRGRFVVNTSGTLTTVSSPANTFLLVNSPMHPADDNGGVGGSNGWSYGINLRQGQLQATGPVSRSVQPNPDGEVHSFTFTASWSIEAQGGVSLQGNITLNQVSPLPIMVGVLELSPPNASGYLLEFDALAANPALPQQIPPFRQIRFVRATLAQQASLGGARVAVQGVLLSPDSEPEPSEKIFCGESCLALRGPQDTLRSPDYKFRMPDLIIQTDANLLAFGDDSGLTIYSSDHPLAANLNSLSFSFEAFEGEIRIRQGQCPSMRDPLNPKATPPPEGPVTTIVEGTAFMNIPGIGERNTDISSAPALTADFMLCALSLREVSLVLTLGDTAVPLGNSGLFLNKVGGYISVSQEATRITLEVGLQAMAPTAAASNLFVSGWLIIDTRGLIDVHANARARVVGSLGYGATGHVWVGWGPLDIGFEVRGCLPHSGGSLVPKPSFQEPGSNSEASDLCSGSELLYGMIRAHLWRGAGWQDRYPHLLGSPPDATHFAGRFAADVTLAEGMVVDWGLFKLPPKDMKVREVDLAIGEFCTNNSCTTYEWGVMGTYGLLGFQVGLYFDFSPSLHFILGSSNYCLIDEIDPSGSCTANVQHLGKVPGGPAEQFRVQVTPDAGSALFGLAWAGGAPTLTLVEPAPGNRVINASSVFPDVTVTISPTTSSEQVILVIDHPLPGNWIVQVDNLTGVVDYDLVFFSNEMPQVNFAVTGPAPITNPMATISWQTAVANPERYTMSFYWETRKDGRNYGGPIVERLPLSASGSYNWNLNYLPGMGPGSPIFIYGQIENGAARVIAACDDAPYNPDPELPCSTMTHPDLGLSGDRIPLGSIIYLDTTPPAAPVLTNVRAQGETSVMVRWQTNDERDLAGYLVTCQQAGVLRQMRQTPHYPGSSMLREAAQVNGLNAGVMAACFVQAYDATGNLSGVSLTSTAVPTGDVPLPPAVPVAVAGFGSGIGSIKLNWANSGNAPAGFLLFYGLSSGSQFSQFTAHQFTGGLSSVTSGTGGGFQANEGASPLDVGAVQSFTLTGLPVGATYNLWVKAYDAEGRTSMASEVFTVQVGSEVNIFIPVVRRP